MSVSGMLLASLASGFGTTTEIPMILLDTNTRGRTHPDTQQRIHCFSTDSGQNQTMLDGRMVPRKYYTHLSQQFEK
ncbi:hypothetical protein CHELA20_53963 [Hyphomicrobiales bacterium]|nr:hypothetical protein CHELA41_20964 [Hyphomicrobiales bacterium]CAH1685314.1 hypothetical protein CHELA20_53963 [Hyphomicrobiales bacterium]